MAVKLQKYQRQVSPTAETGAVRGDIGGAGAEWGAVGRAAEVVGGLAADFGMKLKKHKDEGDLAGYRNSKQLFGEQLELAKNEARAAGITDDQMMEKVIVPKMEQFASEIQKQGYSKDVLNLATTDWNNEVGLISAREQNEILQNSIIRSNLKKRDYAQSLEAAGDIEGAEEVWQNLEASTKPGTVDEWRSGSRYNLRKIEMQEFEREYLETGDKEQYLENLRGIDLGGLQAKHKHTLDIEINAKENQFIRQSVRDAETAVRDFNNKIVKNAVDVSDYAVLRRYLGDNYADAIEKATRTGEITKSVSDTKAKTAVRNMRDLHTGDMSWSEFLRENSKIGGTVGTWTIMAGTDMVIDLSKTQDEFSAYEVMYRDQKLAIGGNTADFIEGVGAYVDQYEGDASEWVSSSLKALSEWQMENPKPTPEEYQEFRSIYFAPSARKTIEAINAPQGGGFGIAAGTEIDDEAALAALRKQLEGSESE